MFSLCVGGAPGSKGKNTVVRRDGSIENVGGKAQVHMTTGVSREIVAVRYNMAHKASFPGLGLWLCCFLVIAIVECFHILLIGHISSGESWRWWIWRTRPGESSCS